MTIAFPSDLDDFRNQSRNNHADQKGRERMRRWDGACSETEPHRRVMANAVAPCRHSLRGLYFRVPWD